MVYMFDGVVACNAIQQAGRDNVLPAGTQILELKLVGKVPATFPMTTAASHIPAAGEAAASYTVASGSAVIRSQPTVWSRSRRSKRRQLGASHPERFKWRSRTEA